jgi:hypothetical protein
MVKLMFQKLERNGGVPIAKIRQPREGMRDKKMDAPEVNRAHGKRVFVCALDTFRENVEVRGKGERRYETQAEGGIGIRFFREEYMGKTTEGYQILVPKASREYSKVTVVVTKGEPRGETKPTTYSFNLTQAWYGPEQSPKGYFGIGEKIFETDVFRGEGFVEIYLSKR